mmetsp:Transcript_11874/g.30429  ORF Transcript_11874/g.30429 Transcript_11874/m.30429 type:complete len:201 (+) Transcript_11874:3361-3963(+)
MRIYSGFLVRASPASVRARAVDMGVIVVRVNAHSVKPSIGSEASPANMMFQRLTAGVSSGLTMMRIRKRYSLLACSIAPGAIVTWSFASVPSPRQEEIVTSSDGHTSNSGGKRLPAPKTVAQLTSISCEHSWANWTPYGPRSSISPDAVASVESLNAKMTLFGCKGLSSRPVERCCASESGGMRASSIFRRMGKPGVAVL